MGQKHFISSHFNFMSFSQFTNDSRSCLSRDDQEEEYGSQGRGKLRQNFSLDQFSGISDKGHGQYLIQMRQNTFSLFFPFLFLKDKTSGSASKHKKTLLTRPVVWIFRTHLALLKQVNQGAKKSVPLSLINTALTTHCCLIERFCWEDIIWLSY